MTNGSHLGPNQMEWLRANLKGFADAEKIANTVRDQTKEYRSKFLPKEGQNETNATHDRRGV